ncbi:hypothetical protein L0B52_03465 [Suttonella sp. R2A3]|uniref:CbrC family protein n=1 Tax=Suttonella sp. R2A3 TaxID=2908648 RepID=UPI001F1ECE8C|nr:hypothetical protein [Suttonella sp. R2A3]UJF25221.1 hypothetical protein L0B52_03465 [Suttonella sp. R2A3]
MGTHFSYIADQALPSLEEEEVCQHCEQEGIKAYAVRATILDPSLSADPELAEEEPQLNYACESCIKSGNLALDEDYLNDLKASLPKGLHNRIENPQFAHQPYIQFLHHNDWPFCCHDLTEYIGETPEADEDYATFTCWRPMSPSVADYALQDFYPLENIEPFFTMRLFRCLHCAAKYWNFQYSGLLWPGPTHS